MKYGIALKTEILRMLDDHRASIVKRAGMEISKEIVFSEKSKEFLNEIYAEYDIIVSEIETMVTSKPFNKTIECDCMACKVKYKIEVKEEDYHNWRNGQLIQNAFPYLTPDQRELLITNICGKCFDKMFE